MRRIRSGSGKGQSRLSQGGVRDKGLSRGSSKFTLISKKHLVAGMDTDRQKVYISCLVKVGIFTEMLPGFKHVRRSLSHILKTHFILPVVSYLFVNQALGQCSMQV